MNGNERCLSKDYSVRFTGSRDDTLAHVDMRPRLCEHIHIPFRTRESTGILYSDTSVDGLSYIVCYIRSGYINLAVRDQRGEKEIILDTVRVDDGGHHVLDIYCEPSGYLVAYIDEHREVQFNNRVRLNSKLYLNSYTLGSYATDRLPTRFSNYNNFRGCLDQVTFNEQCFIYESMIERSRLSCMETQMVLIPILKPATTTIQSPTCVNMCHQDECYVELRGNGYVVYHARDSGARPGGPYDRDQIRFDFRTTSSEREQDLISIVHPERGIRLFLNSGHPVVSIGNRYRENVGQISNYNDGKWHSLVLEQNNQQLIIRIDKTVTAVNSPIRFDLYGDGSIYFGSANTREASHLVGDLKNIILKYSNCEYDVIDSLKDSRKRGGVCQGYFVIRPFVEESKFIFIFQRVSRITKR
jgi:hypothetical protein